MHNRRGFTLIEILVVIVIIGLVSGAMVMVGGDNRRDTIIEEADRMVATLQLALEESQLYGVEMGVAVTEKSYQFVNFDQNRWVSIPNDIAYKKRKLPDGFEFYLEIEGFPLADGRLPGAKINDKGQVEALKKEDEKKEPKSAPSDNVEGDKDLEQADSETNERQEEAEIVLPQIFVLSSGEFNPFVLAVGVRSDPAMFYRIRGTAEGKIKREGPLFGDMVNDLNMPWEDPNEIEI